MVSGKYTESGKPIVSNDPHLGNGIPTIWYQQELNIGSNYVVGASLPGIPYVSIGRTPYTSWTITNAKADVGDWYYEKIDGDKYFHDN